MKWFSRRWYVMADSIGDHHITKARVPDTKCGVWRVVSGPFDTEEDAARSLAFWKRQEPGIGERRLMMLGVTP